MKEIRSSRVTVTPRADESRLLRVAFPALVLLQALAACSEEQQDPGTSPGPIASEARRFWEVHDRARRLYTRNAFEEAARLYEEALALRPAHPSSLYSLAHIELERKNHRRALELLETLKRNEPRETKAYILASDALSDLFPGAPLDLRRARDELERARTINAEDSGILLRDARLACLDGDLERARERLHAVTGTNPRAAEALILLGVLELGLGKREDAGQLFRRAARAAAGTRPPGGVAGEGDTRGGSAGSKEDAALEAAWLAELSEGSLPAHLQPLPESLFPDGGVPLGNSRSGAALAVADLDRDGFQDLVCGSLNGPLLLYRGGPAGPRLAEKIPLEGISGVDAGDLDGDGRPDLYAVRGRSESVPAVVLGSDGLLDLFGLFGEESGPHKERSGLEARDAPGPARRASLVRIADLDLDGRADVVEAGAASAGLGPVRWLWNVGEGELELREVAGVGPRGTAVGLLVVEPPGTDRPEVVVCFAKRAPLLLRVRGGSLTAETLPGDGAGGEHPRAAAALDVDGDGRDDLVLATPRPAGESFAFLAGRSVADRSSLRVLRARDDGGFEPLPEDPLPRIAAGVRHIAAGDLDGDGRRDLVLLAGGPEPRRVETWWLVLRPEGGPSLHVGPLDLRGGLRYSAGVIADLDGDGKSDLALAGGGAVPADRGRLLWFRGRGAGS